MTLDEIFRGKVPIRLAIPRPGTSDVWVLEKMMEFYGLCAPGKTGECYKSWEAAGAKFVRGSYVEQAGAFADRKVDGALAVLALPGTSVADAAVGRKLTLLACPQPLLDHLATFGLGRGPDSSRDLPQGRQRGRGRDVGHHGHHHHRLRLHVR